MKPENILLEDDENLDAIKIIDFGTACPFEMKSRKMLTDKLGTPYYVAPEVLKGKYNEKCDLWSIGVMTYMLLSGKPPFFGTNKQILKSIEEGKWSFTLDFKQVSDYAKSFITDLLTVDPSKRPSAE